MPRVLPVALLLAGLVAGPSGPAPAQDGAAPPPPVDALPTGPTVEERLAEIRRRIQEALVYPRLARARQLEGVSVVSFTIGRDGEPEGLEVADSSGHPSLDRAAKRCVRDAAPLPWVYGRVQVPVRFELDEPR